MDLGIALRRPDCIINVRRGHFGSDPMKSPTEKRFDGAIREILIKKQFYMGLTDAEVAKMADVHPATYNLYMRGKDKHRAINIFSLMKVMKVLEISGLSYKGVTLSINDRGGHNE